MKRISEEDFDKKHNVHKWTAYCDAMNVIVDLKIGMLLFFFIFAGVVVSLKAKDISNWASHKFNDSERIDCLEEGNHKWFFVRHLDSKVTNHVALWEFECSHCYKWQRFDRDMILNSNNLSVAFKKATGIDFK